MTRLNPGDMRPAKTIVTAEEYTEMVAQKEVDQVEQSLKLLREPFPPEMIEKLPKPMWKDAWNNGPKGQCSICNGYHVLANTIHLDYVGHANTTNRLLEVDPFWDWDFLFKDERGMPIYSDGGLWITLTVCGVTRKGFGDGKNAKEIIGDAIRNAAMRFGVALDLWSKIDLHSDRNPDVQAPQQRPERNQRRDVPVRQAGQGTRPNDSADPPRAVNQDALDALGEVCDTNGLDKRWAADRYSSDHDDADIRAADPEDIFAFAAELLAECSGGNEGGDEPTPEEGAGVPAGETGGDDGTREAVGEGDVRVPAPPDPTDTSDVEPKPGDMF